MNSLVSKIYVKAKPKIISARALNSSMFLTLALDYIDTINSEGAPTVVTALDRVVDAEANKIMDSIFEELKAEVDTRANRSKFPIEKDDFDEIMKRIKESYIEKIHLKLSGILNVDGIIKNINGFFDKFQYITQEKTYENYTDSFIYNSSIINKLMESVSFDKLLTIQSDDEEINSNQAIVDFCHTMSKVLEQYENNCKGPAKFDTISEFFIESNFIDEMKLINSDKKVDFKSQK